jgi:hypothetical protein
LVTIDLPDVKDAKIQVTNTHLRFDGTAQGKQYHLELEFLNEINPEVHQ